MLSLLGLLLVPLAQAKQNARKCEHGDSKVTLTLNDGFGLIDKLDDGKRQGALMGAGKDQALCLTKDKKAIKSAIIYLGPPGDGVPWFGLNCTAKPGKIDEAIKIDVSTAPPYVSYPQDKLELKCENEQWIKIEASENWSIIDGVGGIKEYGLGPYERKYKPKDNSRFMLWPPRSASRIHNFNMYHYSPGDDPTFPLAHAYCSFGGPLEVGSQPILSFSNKKPHLKYEQNQVDGVEPKVECHFRMPKGAKCPKQSQNDDFDIKVEGDVTVMAGPSGGVLEGVQMTDGVGKISHQCGDKTVFEVRWKGTPAKVVNCAFVGFADEGAPKARIVFGKGAVDADHGLGKNQYITCKEGK